MLFRSLWFRQSQTAMKRFFTVKSYITPSQRVNSVFTFSQHQVLAMEWKECLEKKKNRGRETKGKKWVISLVWYVGNLGFVKYTQSYFICKVAMTAVFPWHPFLRRRRRGKASLKPLDLTPDLDLGLKKKKRNRDYLSRPNWSWISVQGKPISSVTG